ncbi:hypothetical protein CK203_055371 [Vitis vinifera]|uniref:Integrase catalytic domain-containing protein n=1 Tax=Vitis vinifera TaxID=29760 RepID=A0A438GSW8_VITVI|nr:hypothetical protein CK203_055371 [Vitis vinifera]
MEIDDGLPWYHDIYHFLRLGISEAATAKDRRALRQLATRFVICGETLYRRSLDGILLLCLDRASADRVMREVHAGVADHIWGHMLAHTWRSHSRAALELHALTSPWPFSVWGIDIIGKISPKSSSGHEFILVAIDYFTKWVEAASYARLTSSGVASFIRSHIICRYGVPHELISDRGCISEQRLTPWCRDMASGIIDRLRATPYSLVYGMEAVLPVEIEMGSLRVALEQQIPETDWAQARFDQLNLLDERRLRAADHVRAYQRKMARAFKKRVKPRLHVLTPEGAWLMDLDGNQFSEPTNVDQLKRYLPCIFFWETLLRCLDPFRPCLDYQDHVFDEDDSMSPVFPDLSHIRCHTGAYSVSEDLYGFSQRSHVLIDDSMLSDLRPILHFDAIQGHISVRMRFTDHEGVACLSLFADVCRDDDIFAILAMIP